MSTTETIVKQRDLFLAFAFASADLLIEISPEDKIGFVSGAVKKLIGIEETSLRGRLWTNLFIEDDGVILKDTVRDMTPGRRCGPVMVTLKNGESVLFTAIKMPEKQSVYLTLAVPNALMKRHMVQEKTAASKEEFIKTTQKAISEAIKSGKQVDLTLLELPDLQDMKDRMPPEKWEEMHTMMADLIKSAAIDGGTVTQLSDNRYSMLRDKNTELDTLQDQISQMLKHIDPELQDTVIKSVSVDANIGNLNDKEASRALLYTLNAFEKSGADAKVKNMKEGFSGFLQESKDKIQAFKKMVAEKNFTFNFQPIVYLNGLGISHYEVLTRFPEGGSPYDLITFGEAVGLAMDFDLAVCKKAIDYISKLPKNPKNNRFTLNVSGQSIENDQFVSDLRRLLDMYKLEQGAVTFEITESACIQNLEKVNNVIGLLQSDVFGVCLDDFGAGSASYQYLQKLQVDFIKLDGAYVQHIFDTPKDQMIVRHLAQLCADLKVGMVAERIETAKEAMLLKSMGIGYGQGYWFSKPRAAPDYAIDQDKAAEMKNSPVQITQGKAGGSAS